MVKNDQFHDLVSHLSEQDFVQFLTVKQGFEPTSIKQSRIRFRLIKRFLVDNSLELTSSSIEMFLMEIRKNIKNNNSINTYIFTIKQLDFYCQDRKLPCGFSEGIKTLPKVKPMVDVLSWEEIEKLLSVEVLYKPYQGRSTVHLDVMYRCMTRVLAETGCRYSECAKLTIKDFYSDSLKLAIVDTKNNDSRWVFISPTLRDQINQQIKDKKDNDLIFTSMNGKLVPEQSFIEDLKKRAQIAGIQKRVYPHLFRHSFATDMGKTVNTHEIKNLLGHRDIKSTDGYIHTDAERLRTISHHHPSKMKYLTFEEKKKLILDVLNPIIKAFGDSVDKEVSETKTSLKLVLKDLK